MGGSARRGEIRDSEDRADTPRNHTHRRDGEEDEDAAGGGAAGAVEAGGAQGAAAGAGVPPAAPAGLSPRLLEIRQTLQDPRAVAAFDREFEEVGRKAAATENVADAAGQKQQAEVA